MALAGLGVIDQQQLCNKLSLNYENKPLLYRSQLSFLFIITPTILLQAISSHGKKQEESIQWVITDS